MDAGATPSVAGYNNFYITNSSAQTITNFTNAYEKKVVTLRFGDSNTTINRSNAYLLGGSNFTSTAHDFLQLKMLNPYWKEMLRSGDSW